MIQKIPDTDFGYMFDNDATEEEYNTIINELKEKGIKFKCLICNKETSKFFTPSFHFLWTGNKGITICNSIPDNHFYINRKG